MANKNIFASEAESKEKEQSKIMSAAKNEKVVTKAERETFALSISKTDLQKLRVGAALKGTTVATFVHGLIETLPDEWAEMKIQ